MLHLDVMTVTGKTLGENLEDLKKNGFCVDTHALSIKEAADEIIKALHSEEE